MSSTHQTDAATLNEHAGQGTRLRGPTWLGLAISVVLIYLAFLPPGIYSIDGNAMLAVSESLVTHHSFAVPADLGMPGRDGHFFSQWYPLLSILAVPFVATATQAAHVLKLPAHYVAAIGALVLPAVFTGLTAAFVALIAQQLGSSRRGAFLAALTYAFGTIALVYARTFYAEPLLALLTAASLCLVLAGSPSRIAWAGALAALAVLAKPTGIVVGAVLTAYLFLTKKSLLTKKSRQSLSLVPAAGSLLGLLVYFGYNELRFGQALMFGQPWAFHLGGIAEGFAGLLLSPGRGLLWYSPAMALAIPAFQKARKSNAPGALLIALMFGAFLAIHSLWSFWHGGWSWGPRFLLPALPGLAALLGNLEGNGRRALVLLAIAGFLINAPTLFTFYERYYAEANERGVSERDSLWSFSQAPFLHAWPAAVRQVQDARSVDVRELLSQRGSAPATTVASSRALRIVAIWWWVLPVAHLPRLVGVCISLAMIALACALLRSQVRIVSEADSQLRHNLSL
jgi:Dolichyl-phosphate-mannose-protein mannosyltransferase